MAAHSSTLAWKIPRTEEPGGLQSTGSQSQTGLSIGCGCVLGKFILKFCNSLTLILHLIVRF